MHGLEFTFYTFQPLAFGLLGFGLASLHFFLNFPNKVPKADAFGFFYLFAFSLNGKAMALVINDNPTRENPRRIERMSEGRTL
jgi:hypothetical protein